MGVFKIYFFNAKKIPKIQFLVPKRGIIKLRHFNNSTKKYGPLCQVSSWCVGKGYDVPSDGLEEVGDGVWGDAVVLNAEKKNTKNQHI